jgi:hypothetical protein
MPHIILATHTLQMSKQSRDEEEKKEEAKVRLGDRTIE